MAAKLTTVEDGVHVGPLFPRSLFSTIILEGPDGDVVVDAVGDGPVNLSSDPTNPRWLPLPKQLHDDPEAAVASRWRMAELKPELIVSTHRYPVRGIERWTAGVRDGGR